MTPIGPSWPHFEPGCVGLEPKSTIGAWCLCPTQKGSHKDPGGQGTPGGIRCCFRGPRPLDPGTGEFLTDRLTLVLMLYLRRLTDGSVWGGWGASRSTGPPVCICRGKGDSCITHRETQVDRHVGQSGQLGAWILSQHRGA